MSTTQVQWDKIESAAAHISLRQAAVDAGFDDLAIRELMRVINAHPVLVAHAQVFENLGSLLAYIQTGAVGQPGDWQTHLDQWTGFCQWATSNADTLTRLHGLTRFNEEPKHATDNPHLGEGVGRHAVVAALWCRHESTSLYPPPITNEEASRYFGLQAQLLHSYINARWVWVSLNAYETTQSEREWPIAPAPTAAVSRAIREFSHALYDRLLSGLDTSLANTEFFRFVTGFAPSDDDLLEENRIRAAAYLIHIKRYFRAAAGVHSGLRPRTRRRDGGGGGPGSRDWIPGFVSISGTELLTIRDIQSVHTDPDDDVEEAPSSKVYWTLQLEEGATTQALEVSGLNPAEDLEPLMELVDANDYVKSMYKLHYGQLARDMAAQSYAWDWQHLTRGEMRHLWYRLEQDLTAATQNPPNKSIARYKRITALLIKLMLLCSQPFDRAHRLTIRWIPPDAHFSPSELDEEIDGMVLFARGIATALTSSEVVLGFGLPALSPIYKTDLDDNLSELSRATADGLVLPDLSNLGQQLLAFHRSEAVQDAKVFHIDRPEAMSRVKAFLSTDDERLTLSRVTRALPSTITQQTGDESLAWMACADYSRRTEPRLFYTLHPVTRIRSAYASAARTLLRRVGHQPSAHAPDAVSDDPVHIGCRFVLSRPVLKELVATLKARLTSRYALNPAQNKDTGTDALGEADTPIFADQYRDPSAKSAIMQYDKDYLLYTFLILTITTGTRAINRPVSLYLQWIANGCPKHGMESGLADKDSIFFDKSRMVAVQPIMAAQFKHYLLHIEFLMGQLGKSGEWRFAKQTDQLLLTFDEKTKAQPLIPTWVTKQLEFHLGAPVPSNFSRAFLRTELLERGVSAQIVDAFLGHGNLGESPFTPVSTFDYERSNGVLKEAMNALIQDIGLVPIESRLVPYPTRLATK